MSAQGKSTNGETSRLNYYSRRSEQIEEVRFAVGVYAFNPPATSACTFLPTTTQDRLTNAPLINLVGDTISISAIEGKDDIREAAKFHEDGRNQDLLIELRCLLPDVASLHLVMKETEQFWIIWPAFYCGPSQSDVIRSGNLEAAMISVRKCLDSDQALVVIQAVLWLSLCIQ
jgi:hypothetical protein